MAMIPYGRQDIREQDLDAVRQVLQSDFLTQGPAVPRFEQALCQLTKAHYAIAMNSATSALHAACLALGVGPGDVGWTCPNSFVASANCLRYCGAGVDFVDMDPQTRTMSVSALAAKLAAAQAAGCLPKVLIPVHFGGLPCDMPAISDLARRYGVRIIEDASHAIGASLHDEPVGSCRWSDITVFSFHPVKIITTAEGGAALCRDAQLAAHLTRLRSHGITRDPAEMIGQPDGPWSYQQIELGYNYRMTDMQAALGCSQLSRLTEYVTRRNQLAARYDAAFADVRSFKRPLCPTGYQSAWHLYPLEFIGGTDRLALFNALRQQDLGVQIHYIPIHTQPYYRALGFQDGDFPAALDFYRRTISLPLFPSMTDEQAEYVIQSVLTACDQLGAD